MIRLGAHVKDIVTGFRGLAISRQDSLFAAPKICIEPTELSESGEPRNEVWFSESRVEEIKPQPPVDGGRN